MDGLDGVIAHANTARQRSDKQAAEHERQCRLYQLSWDAYEHLLLTRSLKTPADRAKVAGAFVSFRQLVTGAGNGEIYRQHAESAPPLVRALLELPDKQPRRNFEAIFKGLQHKGDLGDACDIATSIAADVQQARPRPKHAPAAVAPVPAAPISVHPGSDWVGPMPIGDFRKMFELSDTHFRRLRKSGKIRTIPGDGHRVFIHRDDVARLTPPKLAEN